MKNFKLLPVLAVAVFFFICASSAAAQRVGGYKVISKTDAGAVAAANFAVSAQADKTGKSITLGSVQKAESQVVAGTNFRLCMSVTVADEDETVIVVVYRNLKGEFSLTSWVKGECGDSE